MAEASKKRKQAGEASSLAKRPRFPQRPQHQIPAQPTKSAYPNGEVNVKSFLQSHENEIRSLESAMRAAKKGLSRRAFQEVPREMRRRTASHNPQRVPKRLRARARNEAREDNTPISKGKSGSGIGKGKNKFLRKDGIEKSRQAWERRAKARKDRSKSDDAMDIDGEAVTTADSTAKRPAPTKTKSRFPALATPATPPSRFRRRQRDKTWLPTHVWHSKRSRMTEPKDPLWRFALPLQPAVKGYRLAHRAATQRGAIAWDMSYMATISLDGPEASIVGLLKGLHFAESPSDSPWQDRGRAKKWRRGTRTWEGWIHEREATPLRKIAHVTAIWCVADTDDQKRKVFLRVHPSAFKQLWDELVRVSKVQKPAVTVEDLRFEIASVDIVGPAATETICSVLAPVPSMSDDPDGPEQLWAKLASVTDVGSMPAGALIAFAATDPRLHDPPITSAIKHDEESMNTMMEILASWPVDRSQVPTLIFNRNARLAAQRSMPSQKSINRRKSACNMGEAIEPRSTDPKIPILVYTSRESKSWTILLPWKCGPSVWRSMMRYPVSTGGVPRFGGLKERRQVSFERLVPHFPFDHPGTDAGWAWELRERKAREHEWTRRPKGKRIEWSSIDLGNGRKGEAGDPWACAWERLLFSTDDNAASSEKAPEDSRPPLRQLSSHQAKALLQGLAPLETALSTPYLFTAKVEMTQRGTPTDCARIYRLPRNNVELRDRWLSLLPNAATKGKHKTKHDGPPKAGDEAYPPVPDEDDLIGFVTTGNYNLAEGKPAAIANLVLHRIVESKAEVPKVDHHVCIVRQAGATIGRLATWAVV